MIRRRTFVIGLVASSGSLLLAGCGPDDPDRIIELLQLLPEDAEVIGQAALAAGHLPSRSFDFALLDGVRPGPGAAETIRARAREAIRADFSEGRIVVVEGWRLSRTELHLCAAFAELL